MKEYDAHVLCVEVKTTGWNCSMYNKQSFSITRRILICFDTERHAITNLESKARLKKINEANFRASSKCAGPLHKKVWPTVEQHLFQNVGLLPNQYNYFTIPCSPVFFFLPTIFRKRALWKWTPTRHIRGLATEQKSWVWNIVVVVIDLSPDPCVYVARVKIERRERGEA